MATPTQDVLHGSARMNANGRIVIPAAIRQQLGLTPGESLVMEVEDGVLRIESYYARIRRIQREFAQYIRPGVLASDELIAERREEARKEEEEIALQIASYKARLQKAEQVA